MWCNIVYTFLIASFLVTFEVNACKLSRLVKKHYEDAEETVVRESIEWSCCSGYKQVGEYCLPECEEGFVLINNNVCAPACKTCKNGVCNNHGVCGCNKNYARSNENECEPICKGQQTENCIIPNRPLVCDEGFELNSYKTMCVPKKCACPSGYQRNEKLRTCEPICNHCTAKCVKPNECACPQHYSFDFYLQSCVFDYVCSEYNRHCQIPADISICEQGYRFDLTTSECVPHCDGCSNGVCISPNICVCFEGYKQNSVTQECEKIEQCGRDYTFNETTHECVPHCNFCANGHCKTPHNCICNEGYEKRLSDIGCQPVCDNCINGECISPGICICKEGYKMDEEIGLCMPVCHNCYGVCEEPGLCICYQGYKKCRPDQPLIGLCGENQYYSKRFKTCKCKRGYRKRIVKGVKTCQPLCANCANGRCVRQNKCICDEGYEKDPITDKCVPVAVCGDCGDNAHCSSRNICECDHGYHSEIMEIGLSSVQKCVPTCEPTCLYGNCVAPNECVCIKDYTINPNTNQCEPDVIDESVEIDCGNCGVNSFCSKRGCQCNKGYAKQFDGTCQPYCANCDNGKCLAPDFCICHEGYEKNPETEGCEVSSCTNCQQPTCIAPILCYCQTGLRFNTITRKCHPADQCDSCSKDEYHYFVQE